MKITADFLALRKILNGKQLLEDRHISELRFCRKNRSIKPDIIVDSWRL